MATKKVHSKKKPTPKKDTNMAAEKSTMMTQFSKVLKATAEGYASQFDKPKLTQEQEEQIKKLDAVVEAFGADSSYGKRAVKEKAKISVDSKKAKADRAYEVADAIAMAANSLGLGFKLDAKKKASRKSSGSSDRTKVPDDVREKAEKDILKSLKSGELGKSDIQAKINIDDKVYGSAKRSLLDAGKVATVGQGRAAKLVLA